MTDLDEQGRPEPPLTADEAGNLLGFLDFQRATLVDEAIADGGLGGLAQRTWSDGRAPNLRWIITHMIEEYARHNGHADLLRESIDGETGE
jgi:Protein of unknown function (DUF664)